MAGYLVQVVLVCLGADNVDDFMEGHFWVKLGVG